MRSWNLIFLSVALLLGASVPVAFSQASLLSRDQFEQMLKHRNEASCPANGFYTYDAFIAAANSFSGFATVGDDTTKKREIAAFLAQTSHETTGGWATAPDGPYAWGYCFKQEQGNPGDYCQASTEWPCAAGKKYYGRGPIQISYNYNYGPAGKAIGSDLLNNPSHRATTSSPEVGHHPMPIGLRDGYRETVSSPTSSMEGWNAAKEQILG